MLQAGHRYRLAAQAGVVRAQFALGHLYEFGCDSEPRPALARPWYERAAEQGHDGARRRLEALLALLANYFYTTVFALTTLGTLVLLWWRDRRVYSFHRSVLFIMTAGAALTYWLYPLAPPRLVPGAGFVDTVSVFGTWGGAYTSTTAEVANVYGAMPSMHTGWSLWVAVCLCAISTKWWQRVLAVSLPVATILVIMATGNHYALDAMAGALYLGLALLVWMLVLAVRRALGHVDLPTIAPSRRPVRY